MVKGKLILICQSGGEFISNEDGSLSYRGGEANALNVNEDITFDDLKLKLAHLCTLDHKSISIKYFIPGSTRTLVNLSDDIDMKRMFCLYDNSVTTDLYLSGKEGFDHSALETPDCRENGIRMAEVVNPALPSVDDPVSPAGTLEDNEISLDDCDSSLGESTSSDSSNSSSEDSEPYIPGTPAQSKDSDPSTCTPADTVKKRRRAAASYVGLDGDIQNKRRSPTNKKKKGNTASETSEADYVLEKELISHCNDNSDNLTSKELVAQWKKAIKVGKKFRDVYEFREALHNYAIAHCFAYKLRKNDANQVTGRCVVEGCSWRISASKVQSEESFWVRKMVSTHNCEGKNMGFRPSKNWLVGVLKERLRETPKCKPKDIAKEIIRDFGVKVNYSQVRRGMIDVKLQLMGSLEEAYNDLPQLCEKVALAGTVDLVTSDDDKRFQRLFLCFHASVLGFQNGCRPLLFLDSASLESKYHESLLVATALDGNDGLFPVAFAIVDAENTAAWIWFLEKLKAVIPNSLSLTIAFDFEKQLNDSILTIFKDAHIGYTMHHLVKGFKRNMKGPFHGEGRGSLVGGLVAAAHAKLCDGFRSSMDRIKQASPNSYEWLRNIEPQNWASTIFVGERFNHIIDNPIEPFIKLLDGEREFPITRKIESLTQMIVELMHSRRSESSKCPTNSMLTPTMEESLRREILNALKMKVLISTEYLFEVRDKSASHAVNMETRDCTCRFWKVTGLPCSHAVAVIIRTGRNLYDYCSRYFYASNFVATYEPELKDPLPEKGGKYIRSADTKVLPPSISRSLSQDKARQVRQRRPDTRVVICSRCLGAGHNKKTCQASG